MQTCNIHVAAAAAAAIAGVYDFAGQSDWVDDLNDCLRHFRLMDAVRIKIVHRRFAGEDLCRAFTAEQDNTLVKAGDALNDLRIAAAEESVKKAFEEELHVDCVKAFVERDLLDVNETAENLAFTRSNAYRPV